MDLVFDIETDDLKATKIHCIVCQDPNSGEIFKFKPNQIDEGVKFLSTADRLIGHNIVGFDIPVVKKLTGTDLSHIEALDTLVLSRLLNPIRAGGHSLEAWGYKLEYPKISFEEYKNYSAEMLKYCVRDVQLNTLVFKSLRLESKQFSKESVLLEHGVAKIMKEQEENGFKFDSYSAEILLANLRERKQKIEDEVHNTFKPKWVDDKVVTPYVKKDGQLSKRGLSDEEYDNCLWFGNTDPFMRRKLVDFNLGSRKQIGEYLIDFGWKPERFTPTGQPIVDETTLERVKGIPEATLIAEFMMLQKRVAQVSSWLELAKDGRVHGFVIPNGAITGRMTHRNPNVAQTPSSHKPYGKECRECWTVPEGYKLVGIDASGLELRVLAHYMKNKDYINEIISGDIHSTNQSLAGLEQRSQAKTFIYALIYGAGDSKIGSVVGGNSKVGASLRNRFLNNLPSLRNLTTSVERAASTRKYLKALDGRHIHIRKVYSSLNTLLQGGGAVIMKTALVLLHNRIKQLNLDASFVGNIHDEWQIEVREDQAEQVGQLGVQALKDTTEVLKLNCPLDGEYQIGDNWSETH